MAAEEYGMAFVGGGLAATLFLNGLRGVFPGRVLVVDPEPTMELPPVHWGYWSRDPTPYDRFAVGAWQRAGVADALPESISPFVLRLVRSTDVLASLGEALEGLPIEHLRAAARSVELRSDGLYEVITDAGTVRALGVRQRPRRRPRLPLRRTVRARF